MNEIAVSGIPKKYFAFLLFVTLLEFLMLSFCKNYFDIYFSPLVFFGASFSVGFMALYMSTSSGLSLASEHKTDTWAYFLYLPLIIFLVYFGHSIFSKIPIDDNQSDVFAQVLSPNRWLLNGEYPYQTVTLPSYTMHNTYLPMQWLPFLPAVLFGFDPRWVPLIAWAGAICYFFYSMKIQIFKKPIGIIAFLLMMTMSLFGIMGFMTSHKFDYSITLEMLPSAYYIILVLALLRGSPWGIGLSMGACLMSRFSIVLFLPFLVWYVWNRFGWKVLFRSGLICFTFVMCIFVLPFMTQDPSLPQKILGNYDSGSLGEWSHHSWQEEGAEPYQLARGMGAAIFVKKLYEYDIADGIHHLKQAEILLSLVVTFLIIYLGIRNKKKLQYDWLLLGGVKLYFTIFYTLVLIPYPYLFVLPITISSLIIIKAYKDIWPSDSGV